MFEVLEQKESGAFCFLRNPISANRSNEKWCPPPEAWPTTTTLVILGFPIRNRGNGKRLTDRKRKDHNQTVHSSLMSAPIESSYKKKTILYSIIQEYYYTRGFICVHGLSCLLTDNKNNSNSFEKHKDELNY